MKTLINIIAICTVFLTACSTQVMHLPNGGGTIANNNFFNKKRAENFSATPVEINGQIAYAISSTSVGMDNVAGPAMVAGAWSMAEQAKQITQQKLIDAQGTQYLLDADVKKAAINASPTIINPETQHAVFSPAVR